MGIRRQRRCSSGCGTTAGRNDGTASASLCGAYLQWEHGYDDSDLIPQVRAFPPLRHQDGLPRSPKLPVPLPHFPMAAQLPKKTVTGLVRSEKGCAGLAAKVKVRGNYVPHVLQRWCTAARSASSGGVPPRR